MKELFSLHAKIRSEITHGSLYDACFAHVSEFTKDEDHRADMAYHLKNLIQEMDK